MTLHDVSLDVEELFRLAGTLEEAARVLDDAGSVEELTSALADVRSVADAGLPEWVDAARAALRRLSEALAF